MVVLFELSPIPVSPMFRPQGSKSELKSSGLNVKNLCTSMTRFLCTSAYDAQIRVLHKETSIAGITDSAFDHAKYSFGR